MNSLKKMALCLALAALAAMTGCGPKSNPPAETAAVAAAQSWLSLLDAGKYGESWDQAAQVLRDKTSRERWIHYAKEARDTMGTNVSRKVSSKWYRTSLPGIRNGESMVIEFIVSFQNMQSKVETVTVILEPDGAWRVSRYLRPGDPGYRPGMIPTSATH